MKLAIEERAQQERIAYIIPGFGDMNEVDKEAVCKDLEDIAIWLDLSLDQKEKHENPKIRKNIRTELKSFEKKIIALRNAFHNLSAPARREFEKRVSRGTPGSDQQNKAELNRIDDDFERLQMWAAEAQWFNSDGRGQPKKTDPLDATKKLAELWHECVGEKPTIVTPQISTKKTGAFLDLCEAVIVPIYERRGLPLPSIQSLAQATIYPSNDEDK